ncbi:hypothetical protein [Pedomonas mirosovicensis]|uniref:hypothetical protein n=1 Tax=Pedomonas mirosovicensis TaxID=2908641 RepID=UPI002166EC4A|nr:hypothetical protein [Pedomonas mirosovicensis]MCH8685870.1 hypothetical protein [Pedomonas mirosovicensis]
MTFDEMIEAFCSGTLENDMPRIALLRQGSQEGEEIMGPGTLRQNIEGEIELKCHVGFDDPQRMIDLINRSQMSEAGALFAETDYYHVTATDAHDAVWDAGSVLINSSISLPMAAGVIRAKPKLLRRHTTVRTLTSSLKLHFFDQAQRNWRGLIGGPYTVELDSLRVLLTVEQAREGQIKVLATCDDAFPEAFERRLVEALQFVVGQSLHCAVVDVIAASSRTLSLYGATSHIRRVPSFPPLATHTTQYTSQLIGLLRCYLRYLMALPDEGIWSPPSSFLSLLRRSSESSIDGWLIGICVAVEGLAGLIEFEPSKLADELASFQENAAAWISAQGISDGNRKRIEGLIGQLNTVRPRDRMMSLVPGGYLLEDDIKTWTKARNSAVHTRRAGLADLKPRNLQKSIDQLHRIYRLLYSIIFYVIGYRGVYTDYAERGFPEKDDSGAPTS